MAYLMIHNQMSHNQAKNWVLSLIYRAAIDFKKSKKKIESTGPRRFLNVNFFFQRKKLHQQNKSSQYYFSAFVFLLNRAAGELYDLAEVCDPDCNFTTISRMSKSCPNDVNT